MENPKDIYYLAKWNRVENHIYRVLLIDWLNELVDLEYGNIEVPFNEVEIYTVTRKEWQKRKYCVAPDDYPQFEMVMQRKEEERGKE
ncbi:hypothetical protein [Macrococcus brunensis]|uniref:hypothetical protein n=1 Tax=Macrococcus brunensis TaxID=198483 RepID=UPI001EEFB04E|nr:hypothetical protein [Macrococcus brunensis]ULG73201.1 hypothetical protein MGG13_05605 [Macrococcus brunensis]